MEAGLQVIVNGETVLEYHAHKRLPGHVRSRLDEMDADMSADLVLNGERIERPGSVQCAQFVGMKLMHAIESGNQGLQALTCAWLCSRLPTLRQICAEDTGNEINMQLIME